MEQSYLVFSADYWGHQNDERVWSKDGIFKLHFSLQLTFVELIIEHNIV